ncbi:MAG: hypothetical protein ABR999_10765 [Methanoregula sp.]|jgi:hypothetical protein|uniref:hypothetical protein n=1 Tax=Methanoregula sp. TaxID=2052170 RepID=UPI003D10179C
MQINIQKVITDPLDLGGYHKAYVGQTLQVWVNPPREKRQAYMQISRRILEAANEVGGLDPQTDKKRAEELDLESKQLIAQADAWLAEMWSQGAVETHLSVAEVVKLREETFDIDPRFFGWLVGESLRLMLEHQGIVKKA